MPDPAAVSDATRVIAETPLTLVGILIGGITALAGVVVFLFLRYDKRNEQIAAERKEVHDERSEQKAKDLVVEVKHREVIADMKLTHETKLKELSQRYGEQLAEAHRQCNEKEQAIRQYFADMIEGMAVEQAKARTEYDVTTNKLLDRLVGGVGGGGRRG